MIPKKCKRLAEVDFPIAVVSKHSAREKSIRHGHPSTLHLWWARRPLAACRAMLMALLLPDPCDPHCPAEFKSKASTLFDRPMFTIQTGKTDAELRQALLKFIGDFADWDNSSHPVYLEIGRGLVKAAHPEETPLVVDPFAGGGSIPLEVLRLGCDAFASDLNPVACLINKVLLEDIPRHGPELAEELRRVGAEVKKATEQELAEFYPRDTDGARPIAYLWARTVRCEAPSPHGDGVGQIHAADAIRHPLPDGSAAVWFTDPPYYDAIPYSDLSDFFFVWLKRIMPGHPLLRDPFDAANPLSPKRQEVVQDETKMVDGKPKDRGFFEATMAKAFAEGHRVLHEDGIGSVVFAHKTTEGWEALLSGLIGGGWVITASWPIATERLVRMRSQESAALATSVHLICRPRPEDAPVGDWGQVLRELPRRVADWMTRLQEEGVGGADLVFACIGPALEIFSRYTKVVDAEEREIPLGGNPEAREAHQRGYLTYVWEVVGRMALEQVLGTAESRARNGGAEALEEDARLTALFLWTLQATTQEAEPEVTGNEDESEEPEEEDEEVAPTGKKKKKGLALPFDVARRFAQPLGIHLDAWEGRCIETEKGVVRLIPVLDRAKQLFGEDGAEAVADQLEKHPTGPVQRSLFPEDNEPAPPTVRGRKRKGGANVSDESLRKHRGATTLDHVHAAMLLQASGRANALRALLKSETERGPDFLRLANALSALYPPGSDEKRLVDAMLLAVPR